MEFYDVLARRRSIRAYRKDPVPAEVLDRIARAALEAPSACNLQPYRFLVLTDPGLIARLNETTRQKFIGQAPVVIAALGNDDASWHRDGRPIMEFDLGIVMEHIVLAAAAEGLGSCYIGAFDTAAADRLLQVPSGWRTVMLLPLGYPAEEPRPFVRSRSGSALWEIVK
ncbi:MAG: nitroreductase family protein [Lentisphaeria bacterium]|nr:nitroreductase family protein [Lentisphaeria bacterium]